jgi:hypothetical protein
MLHVTNTREKKMQKQSVKERVSTYRSRQRAAGFKSVQIWVPDPKAPGFAEECRRQSLMVADDPEEMRDLETLAEIADWGDD